MTSFHPGQIPSSFHSAGLTLQVADDTPELFNSFVEALLCLYDERMVRGK